MDKLHGWFEEAKQALSIAEPICEDANDIVVIGRKQMEQAVLLWAQVQFIDKALDQQIKQLLRITKTLKDLERLSGREFESINDEIKLIDSKLGSTLERLNNTRVDPGFRHDSDSASASESSSSSTAVAARSRSLSISPTAPAGIAAPLSSNPRDSTGQSLKSFVHEEGIEELKHTIAQAIGRAQDAVKDIDRIAADVSTDIASLQDQKKKLDQTIRLSQQKSKLEKAHEMHVRGAKDAHAMAAQLENLANHYDLCQNAINMSQDPDQYSDDLNQVIPILSDDSAQVERVLEDLYGRRTSLEKCGQGVGEFAQEMEKTKAAVQFYMESVYQFGITRLTVYSDYLDSITSTVGSSLQEADALKKELESLVEYYTLFYKAYQALVVETLRRRKSQERFRNMIADMEHSLRIAHQEETQLRHQFLRQHGSYLPADLWKRLEEPVVEPKIEYQEIDIPQLTQETIAEATRQVPL